MKNQLDDARFASTVRQILDNGTLRINEKVAVRLFEARQHALDRHVVTLERLTLAGVGRFFAESLQSHYRGILALLALLFGASGVQFWQNFQSAAELAEIDSALLSDEVSPNAYIDQGFIEWLDRISQQEENSLPQ
jgi:hypothetical protein